MLSLPSSLEQLQPVLVQQMEELCSAVALTARMKLTAGRVRCFLSQAVILTRHLWGEFDPYSLLVDASQRTPSRASGKCQLPENRKPPRRDQSSTMAKAMASPDLLG